MVSLQDTINACNSDAANCRGFVISGAGYLDGTYDSTFKGGSINGNARVIDPSLAATDHTASIYIRGAGIP